eukprot:IDg11761t1
MGKGVLLMVRSISAYPATSCLRIVCVSQRVCIEVPVFGVLRDESIERRKYRLIGTLRLAVGLKMVLCCELGLHSEYSDYLLQKSSVELLPAISENGLWDTVCKRPVASECPGHIECRNRLKWDCSNYFRKRSTITKS